MSALILIVEDHDIVRHSLHEWLEKEVPRCQVIEAGDGEQAVALAQVEKPQLVLMDIGLPGINGIEATRQIKAVSPEAHVVMLTIHEGESYRVDAMAAGASAFVTKKMMRQTLIPTIIDLLGKL